MKKIWLFLAVVAIVILSCDLERSNPLDPDNNGNIDVPSEIKIENITASGSGSASKWVEIEWNKSEDAAYYKVYRALDYNGTYSDLYPDGIPNTSDSTSYTYRDNNVYSGNYYWYRLAGRSAEGLIGPLSAPSGIGVQ